MKKITYLDKVANVFEIVIAVLILVVIMVKLFDTSMEVVGLNLKILQVEFHPILSTAFSLVIGVELVRMLCKHTPETIIDVLLFAIARHMVLYSEGGLYLLFGVLSIGGLFVIKQVLLDKGEEK